MKLFNPKNLCKLVFFVTVFCTSNFVLAMDEMSEEKKMHFTKYCQGATKFFTEELAYVTFPATLKNIVLKKQEGVIVDVRAPEAYSQSRVPGSINIPFTKHNSFSEVSGEFPELTKTGYNYVYCYETFCQLSQKACRVFNALGYPSIEVRGGFKSYEDHNYPIETPNCTMVSKL